MMKKHLAALGAAFLFALTGCNAPAPEAAGEHGAVAAADFERGPHNGRMLRDGDFALEITIYEEGVPPEFRVYPYVANEAVDPAGVRLAMAASRLGGRVDRFTFQPQGAFLKATSSVVEPHSFDVSVNAARGTQNSMWSYATYEGRTTIARAAADEAGVKVEVAGPADMEETLDFSGRVEIQPEARVEVRGIYPGPILELTKALGQNVARGEVLARIRSSDSLQTYAVMSPIAGVVLERGANPGDVAAGQALYVIADLRRLHADLSIHPEEADRVRAGQKVEIRNLSGTQRAVLNIETILPQANAAAQTLAAHIELPGDGNWRPGMGVEGVVTIDTQKIPLAVRTSALQRFRDFTVVYARVGDTYEVRMLQLGRQTPEWTEVLGGLEPGTEYVTENAFLIRADVEKSGATHDH